MYSRKSVRVSVAAVLVLLSVVVVLTNERNVFCNEVKYIGRPELGLSYGKAKVKKAKRWIMYNKPWKTGSTSISNHLGECAGMKGYTEVKFRWLDSDDIINPVTPALQFAAGNKHFSVQHGRYNIAELRDLKRRSTYSCCYLTSVRNPVERVPSNAFQLVDSSVTKTLQGAYNKTASEMQKLVCQGLKEMKSSPQYLAHYMVGMHWNREMNLTTEQTQFLAQEVVATYDIILDKAGNTLYDSLDPACDEIRPCLVAKPEKMNSKLGDMHSELDYSECKEDMDRLVGEERKFYRAVLDEIERVGT